MYYPHMYRNVDFFKTQDVSSEVINYKTLQLNHVRGRNVFLVIMHHFQPPTAVLLTADAQC